MAGSTDRKHPLEAEIPFLVRIEERQNVTAGRRVHMDRNVITRLGIVNVQRFVEGFHIVVQSGPRHALDRNDTDRILIAHSQGCFGIERIFLQRQGHGTHLDLPELAEFFPYHLETGRYYEIRFVVGFALRFTFFAPAQPRGHTAQHTGLGRTDRQCTCLPLRFFRGVPQIRHNVDTTSGHHRYTGIFRFIDIVHIDRLVHQFGGVRIHVCGYKSSQVQPGLGLRIGFVLDHLVGDFRRGRLHRNRVGGCRRCHCRRTVNRSFNVHAFFVCCAHNVKF